MVCFIINKNNCTGKNIKTLELSDSDNYFFSPETLEEDIY